MDIERQRRIGIKQAKRTIAKLIKKRKDAGVKLSAEDHEKIQHQQNIIARWQRAKKDGRGWHL